MSEAPLKNLVFYVKFVNKSFGFLLTQNNTNYSNLMLVQVLIFISHDNILVVDHFRYLYIALISCPITEDTYALICMILKFVCIHRIMVIKVEIPMIHHKGNFWLLGTVILNKHFITKCLANLLVFHVLFIFDGC